MLKGPYAFCHFGFVVTAVCCTLGTKPIVQAGKQLTHGAVNETVCCDVPSNASWRVTGTMDKTGSLTLSKITTVNCLGRKFKCWKIIAVYPC